MKCNWGGWEKKARNSHWLRLQLDRGYDSGLFNQLAIELVSPLPAASYSLDKPVEGQKFGGPLSLGAPRC